MVNISSHISIFRTWAALKSYASDNNFFIRYDTVTNTDFPHYQIFVVDDSIIYFTIIYTGTVPTAVNQGTNDSDKSDFETNYLPLTVKPEKIITSSGNTQIVGTSSDNSTNITAKLPVIAARANASAPTWTEGNQVPLSVDNSGALRITGSISATNPSVSTTGTSPPASATYLGGSVTTAAPTYTTGQMSALSLDTSGALRITGSISASNPSVNTTGTTPPASATLNGGSVTTAAPTYTSGQMSSLSLNTAGGLRVDGSGATQPISGTVTANQGGTWTVQPGNTANTTAWKVDGSAVTQPVSGTVTANLGTISGVSTETSLSKLTISQSTALGSNTQILSGGSVTTAAPTYTTGNINPLSLTTAGALRVDGSNSTQPVSGTVTANAGTGNFTVIQSTATNLRAQTAAEATTASAIGTVAVLSGGSVTTAAPTYTTGQMNSLSLTTSGALRTDSSSVTQPVSGTITANLGTIAGVATETSLVKLTVAQSTALGSNTQILSGGSVTTAAPAYTTGNINPLSLTTSGALRTDSSNSTQPVSGTVTANFGTIAGVSTETSLAKLTIAQGTALGSNTQALSGGSVTTAAPTYTTGTIQPLSLDTAGALRITGSISASNPSVNTTGSAPPGSATYIGGSVTTAAPTYTNGQMSGLSITTAGALRTDSSATTQPVSGTITSNQGGTWTVQPGNTANTTAWKVDGSAVTQPVSGTVTANFGTIAGVSTETSLAKLTIAQGASLGSNTQALSGGSVTTAAPTYTTGTIQPLSIDTSGALRITGSISASNPSVSTTGTTPPSSATYLGGSVTTAAPTYTTGQMSALSLDTAGALRVSGSFSAGAPADTTSTGTLNALNATVQLTLAGQYSCAMQLIAGTLIGTIIPEISVDGGTTWISTFFDDIVTGNKSSSIVFGSNNLATTRTIFNAGGSSHARIRVSAFTSGTATCNLRASGSADASVLFSGSAASALPVTIAQTGGSVTTAAPTYTTATLNALSLTTAGSLRVIDPGLNLAQASSTSGQTGAMVLAAATTAAPTYTTATLNALSVDTIGNLRTATHDTLTSGTLNALNAAATLTLEGTKTVAMSLAAGTLIGTLTPECSVDGGTNWIATRFTDPKNTIVFASSNPLTISIIEIIPGSSHVRVRVSAFTSGTAACSLRSTVGLGPQQQIKIPSNKYIYTAGLTNSTPAIFGATAVAATATDIFTITGSSTKTIRILSCSLTAAATAASGIVSCYIVRRSTADTGGTSTAPTIIAMDPNFPAGTATAAAYTANPTLGTLVGVMDQVRIIPTAVATNSPAITTIDFTKNGLAGGIVLRGTASQAAVNFNGAAVPAGLVMTCFWTFIEE